MSGVVTRTGCDVSTQGSLVSPKNLLGKNLFDYAPTLFSLF